MVDTILFDLDGTLLPVAQEPFVKSYFGALCKRVCPYGYDKDEIVKGIWAGTAAMYENDGSRTNREAFWEVFGRGHLEEILDDFYAREFDAVRSVLVREVDRGPFIRALKQKGLTLILATNPVFPAVAIRTRLAWIGLVPEDFELVTDYASSRFCKPAAGYFKDILGERDPARCVMVGNSPVEDMAAARLGMDAILVTDCLEGEPVGDGYRSMTFAEMEKELLAL
ncbi:MAG TPA: HAD family hydrolase [Candidatus Acidoferrum sp.]|nr:HAD family hydrolase [Candidatus Acidoferrum sp.]